MRTLSEAGDTRKSDLTRDRAAAAQVDRISRVYIIIISAEKRRVFDFSRKVYYNKADQYYSLLYYYIFTIYIYTHTEQSSTIASIV